MHQSSVVEVVSAPALNKSRQVSSRDSWSNVRFSPFSTYHKTLSGVFWAKFTSAKKTSRKSLGWLTSLVTLCSSMLSRNIARSSLMILIRAFKPGTREAMMPHHGSAYCSANMDLNVLFSWWASRFQTTLRRFLPKIILSYSLKISFNLWWWWSIPVKEFHQPLGLWVFEVESLSSDDRPENVDHRDPKHLNFCDS